jgi:hypothetical protein
MAHLPPDVHILWTAFLLDDFIPEPPNATHPLALMGMVIGALRERVEAGSLEAVHGGRGDCARRWRALRGRGALGAHGYTQTASAILDSRRGASLSLRRYDWYCLLL